MTTEPNAVYEINPADVFDCPEWATEVARYLFDNPDSAECQSPTCVWQPPRGIGHALQDDENGHEQMRWVSTWAYLTDEGAIAICEDDYSVLVEDGVVEETGITLAHPSGGPIGAEIQRRLDGGAP